MPTQAIPSYQRVEPGSVNIPVEDLTKIQTAKPTDIDNATEEWVSSFNKAIQSSDLAGLTDLFLPNAFWRDHLCLTWDFHTIKGTDKIHEFLKQGCRLKNIAVDRSSDFRKPVVTGFDGQGKVQGVQTFLTTESDVGRGMGVARLVETEGKLKAFTLFTSMRELKGHEEATFGRRPEGVSHGEQPGRKNWQERRIADENYEDSEPAVLILGAGQGGLTPAARLKMLGVDALIIDRNERVGDNWRQRYHQLVLHDPVWYDHLPYINFPANWPIFTPKDKLAEFFETYAKLLELNVWTSTTIKESHWDKSKGQWTVVLERKKKDGTTETRTIHPKHIIQATGHSGEKDFPSHIPGISDFKGDRLCHSSEFTGADLNGKGKKAIVVGCCNSGHDIAQDFYEKGYDVTMIQRSSTCVISSRAILEIGLAGLYDEQGPPVEDADVAFWSIPSSVLKSIQVDVTATQNKHDAKVLEGLEKAGFKLDQGPDNSGLFMKYFQRGGGYYIDVGASQLIADGKIKIKQGQEIAEVLPHGMKFADGSELPADEIIFATGYKNMRTQARTIFGDEIADSVKDVWGFDEEGEVRTMWRKSGHPGFWFFGGNLALCRYWSRMIALQIKALEEGICKYDDR
ncbi:dimethylaniline monooxygenase (N-oxide forming) [Hyaloscypha hepaticicola]|uniref:Dimethylaniline monooxygenase (N-oxide forming) n=1 Tax=Hyaloscypha hepaticicola TaxID=2082293 RepID=A0A2J6PHL4_9HELO|nr:dimethylaniline monooxygenase (N-oxide forming) [Hyaloscypha hepaticicola]